MALEIKPIHFIDLDNIKCERRYEVVELTEDPLSIPNDWNESPQLPRKDRVVQKVKLELQGNCAGFKMIDKHNEDKTTNDSDSSDMEDFDKHYGDKTTDDSDSSDMEEFTVYPSIRQDLTSTTGIASVIRSILKNNKGMQIDLGESGTLGSMEANSELSNSSCYEENNFNNPKKEICNNSGYPQNASLNTLKCYENYDVRVNENFNPEKSRRYHSNSWNDTSNRGEKPCETESIYSLPLQNLNFEPIALNKSVTITPIISNLKPRCGSEDTRLSLNAQDKQNLTFNEGEQVYPLATNVSIPTINNDEHSFSINRPHLVSNNNCCHKSNHLKSEPACKQTNIYQKNSVTMKTSTSFFIMNNESNYEYQSANLQNPHTLKSNKIGSISLNSYRNNSTLGLRAQNKRELNQVINCINGTHSNSTIVHQSLHEPSTFTNDNSTLNRLSDIKKKYTLSQINLCTRNRSNENTIDETVNLEYKNPTSVVNMILPLNPISGVIPCVHCSFKTTDFHDWFFHNKSSHNTVSVICPFCGYRQSKKPYMQIHVCSVHLGCKPYSCHICPFSTGWKSYLKIHLSKHNESPQLPVENVYD